MSNLTDKKRKFLLENGMLWQVYLPKTPDDILFEGQKSNCMNFIRENYGLSKWKRGEIRIGNLILEHD